MADLEGRVALVTGGAAGIGLGISTALIAAGARVVINDLDGAAAKAAADRLGPAASWIGGDVSDENGAAAIVATAAARGLDILVNNAGLAGPIAAIGRQRLDDWQRVIDVNLRGPYLMSRAAADHLIKSRGTIVNIGSVAGLVGFSASHAYGVSKAGVAMLTRTLACELARYGVRVNAVAPGVIDAPMLAQMTGSGAPDTTVLDRVPLGRLGATQDVGNAVVFLSSEAASYITGTVLPVDGGWQAFGGAGPASIASRRGALPL